MAKIRLNENPDVVETVKKGLNARGGYCPCRLEMTEDMKELCHESYNQLHPFGESFYT